YGSILKQYLWFHEIDEEELDFYSGVADFPLILGNSATTPKDLAILDKCYLLNEHAQQMCRVGPTNEKPMDDNIATPEPMLHEEGKMMMKIKEKLS
ncbi:hypothetical protein HAX54_022147, partial [Datura stramonium]|nr:hypothetical protein [Datura stramonium]